MPEYRCVVLTEATGMSMPQKSRPKSAAQNRIDGESATPRPRADTPLPPLQPRATRRRSAVAISNADSTVPLQLHKRSSSTTNAAAASLPPHLPPRSVRRSMPAGLRAIPPVVSPNDVGDVAAARPLKRRRLSHNTSPQRGATNASVTAVSDQVVA